ncbi:MAG: hypothetical protein EOO01_19290 [Chitinophagaceae bacterium]|nr:MAG: hypothetical protein EOO01_19290 [Chitinophagaceae bacterium]
MKSLVVTLMFAAAAASAQTADSLSFKAVIVPAFKAGNFHPAAPVMLLKPAGNFSTPKLDFNYDNARFLPARITVNDALRQNLMTSDPYLRAMLSPNTSFSGSGGALDMMVPQNNGLTVWSSN